MIDIVVDIVIDIATIARLIVILSLSPYLLLYLS